MREVVEKPEPGVSKNLLQVLNELQGKICFVKEMTATNVRPRDQEGRFRPSHLGRLSLPKPFAGAHRTKIISKCALLHSRMSDRTWSLRVAHYPARGEFAFTTGWREFVADNGVLKSDILVFSLTAMSEFLVYMFDSQGLPKPPPTLQSSRSFTTELKVSPRIQRVLESPGIEREDSTADENENKSRVTRSKRKARSVGESADLASVAARQTTFRRNARSTKAKTMEYSPSKTCHCIDFSDQDELVKEEPLADQEAFVMRLTGNNEAEISDRNLKPKIHASPMAERPASFQKQLANGNLARMEIPAAFLKKYGSRLRSRVRLQGTLRNSPARDVLLVYSTYAGQSRCYFQGGWRGFVRDNMLRAGQNICFTLTVDSSFKVREV